MKVIDQAAQKESPRKPDVLSKVLGRIKPSLAQKAPQPAEVFTDVLNRCLDNHFVLLRNIALQGLDFPVPLILVGPPGVWVIYPSAEKGVFRAQEADWKKIDPTTKKLIPAKPNLITRAALIARAVEKFLSSQDIFIPSVEPLLFLSHPGAHVDANRPAVRIVLQDALERFCLNLLQSQVELDPQMVQRITNALSSNLAERSSAQVASEIRDAFSLRDTSPKRQAPSSPLLRVSPGEPGFAKKLPFSRRQWLFLGLLLILNIIIIVILVMVFLITI